MALKTVPESKAEHQERVRGYNDTFLVCRDLRHSWEVFGHWRNGAYISRRLVCSRCSTERIDFWTPSGIRENARYIYPDDYCLKGDHIEFQELRKEVLRRTDVYTSEDEMIEAVFSTNGKKRRRSA